MSSYLSDVPGRAQKLGQGMIELGLFVFQISIKGCRFIDNE